MEESRVALRDLLRSTSFGEKRRGGEWVAKVEGGVLLAIF